MDCTKHFALLQVQGTPTGPSVNPFQQREVSGLVSAFTTYQSRGKDPPTDEEGVGCSGTVPLDMMEFYVGTTKR